MKAKEELVLEDDHPSRAGHPARCVSDHYLAGRSRRDRVTNRHYYINDRPKFFGTNDDPNFR